ncbi:MAG: HAD-IIA family hydrolase [Anaerolineae bacterium]|nr:HAD-IIA family hydrolase [Anaerolineae bacterium]MDQ7036454.1 HAD-IIA family hydrolase [Anaerolineae bacterium]
MSLLDIKAVVSDMDGVLWRGQTLLPGMVDFFTFLRGQNMPFVLATNNSGRHPEDYIQKLADMGVADIETWQIVTSGTATVDYLTQHYPHGARLYVIGNLGLFHILEEADFTIIREENINIEESVDAVVAGIDFDFTYQKARTATLLIRNHGAAFIGTNPDVTFPSPAGLVPGAGSVIGMIQHATDVEPTIIGKPKRAMFDVALQRLGTKASETLMLGDRLSTDIEGGHAAGLRTAMLLTGVSRREDISNIQPDYIFKNLPALMKAWC